MVTILWEFRVKANRRTEFEEVYGPDGPWDRLFRRSKGYMNSELLCDVSQPDRFITVDHWESLQDYESFQTQWKAEYASLDAQCGGLTESEKLLGRWISLPPRAG